MLGAIEFYALLYGETADRSVRFPQPESYSPGVAS
jgi:hypothetical protein